MRKRAWLVAVGILSAQASLTNGQDAAQAPGESAPSPPPQEAPPSADDDAVIYPRAPAQRLESIGGYPAPSPQVPTRYEANTYGNDVYSSSSGTLQITPPNEPYRLSVHQKYPLKVDLQAEVPIPLTDDHDASSVGFGFSGMFGWDLGFLVPTFGLGWSWAHLNLPPGFHDDHRNLKRFHMNVGLIAEFENRSLVTPVVGALLDLNWWHVSGDDSIACGGYYYWGCYQVENYRYTTGFSFKAGADFRFFRNDRFTLGTGVLPQVTLKGGPFPHSEWWLSPYVVFTVRN